MSVSACRHICITQCVPQEKHLSSAAKDVSRKLRSNPIKQTLTKAFPTLTTSSKVGFQHSAKRNKKHGPYVRPAKRECILMKQFSSVLPKSKDRAQLRTEQRTKDLLFTRTLSPVEVQNVIRQGFCHLQCQAFQFLESQNGCCMYQTNKTTTGWVSVIERRGVLYL